MKETLAESIQKVIDANWGNETWKASKGFEVRENARILLLNSFLSKNPKIVQENDIQIINVEQVDNNINNNINNSINEISTAKKNNQEPIKDYTAEAITWAIEQRVYDSWFVFYFEKYARQIRLLSTHISRNPWRFIKLDPCFVATMCPEELGSDIATMKSGKKRKAEEKQEDIFGGRSEHQCWKCKGFDVSYYGLQIRGADEPETLFFTCKNQKCNNRWKL